MDVKGKRRFERADFHVEGSIVSEGVEIPFQLENISLKGILITVDEGIVFDRYTPYDIVIRLPNSAVSITARARLLHERDGQRGFRFDSIDPESMIHLRRLLELNISMEDEIERELPFLKDA